MDLLSYNIKQGDVFLINGYKWFIDYKSEWTGNYSCYPYFKSKRGTIYATFDK